MKVDLALRDTWPSKKTHEKPLLFMLKMSEK